MASSLIRDPNNPIDEERRRRARARLYNPSAEDYVRNDIEDARQAYRQGGLGRVISEGARATKDMVQVGGADVAQGINRFFQGPEAAARSREAVDNDYYAIPQPEAPAAPPADFSGVQTGRTTRTADQVRELANARSNGLTRIVKTADGTYVQTSDPNVKGQERIYDELGNRADRAAQAGFEGGPLRDVRDSFAREQAAPSLLDTGEGREQIINRGRASLQRIGRMQEEAGSRRDKAFLDAMSPKERVDLLEAQAKESGLDRRAAATLAVQREGQQAALINAKAGAAGTAIKTDQYERERLSDPTTRASAFREFFGSLPLDEESRINAILQTERGRRILDAATQAGAEGSGNPGFNPASAKRSNGLIRAIGGDPFTDDSQLIGGRFDPADYGLSEQDYDLLIKAARQRYVGQ